MSSNRLERRLPEVLVELSLPRVPDYTDDLLSRTARMPQRPGWTFPERWFPVSILTAVVPAARRPVLRPLIAVAVVLALVLASLVWYVGSQRHQPPPFGPARNGAVVTTNGAGDLVSIDPATDVVKTLVAGPNVCCADVAPDGQRIAFLRVPTSGGAPIGLGVVGIDGSAVRDLPADIARGLEWSEWAPAGDRILITNGSGPLIVDVATGAITRITAPSQVTRASWIGTSGDVLVTSSDGTTLHEYRLPAGVTSTTTELVSLPNAVNPPLVSPDGSRFLYFIWGPEDRQHGDVHVFDFATGVDRPITEEGFNDNQTWENPVWSPDGNRIAAELYGPDGLYQVAVIPATGGTPVLLGPKHAELTNGAALRFSPDGASLLVKYRSDNTTWLLPAGGGEGRQLSWDDTEDIAWQRLAP